MPGTSSPSRRRQLAAAVIVGAVVIAAATLWVSDRHRNTTISPTAVINPLPNSVGFSQPGEYIYMSASDIGRAMDAMVATGARTIRVPVPWSVIESTQGQLNWAQLDAIISAANARSLGVLGIIAYTPTWALAPGAPQVIGQPASAAQFGSFAGAVAARYQASVSAYEIWNEPNTAMFFGPQPDATAYTSLLKAAYTAIKSVSASITVLGGVLISDVDKPTAINPVTFLSTMYAAGAGGYLDAVSFHPYQYTLAFSAGIPVPNSPVNQLMDMRTVMVNNGDSAKQIWSTEYGAPTSLISEAQQSALIADFVTKWQEMPYTGPLMIYTTHDKNTASTDPEDTFGVFRSDWTPKQAQQALQSLLANSIPRTPEWQQFAAITDPTYGTVLSPVVRATSTVWSQVRTNATLYETSSGFIASPNPVAAAARPFSVAPTTPFANGFQDFDSGVRIYYSAATGAHAVGGGIAAAWTPDLGLAVTGEVPQSGGGVAVDFEHGRITWTPNVGATVTRF